MALTPSNMLALGTLAPSFSLLNPATQQQAFLNELAGDKATVIMFICNHCPYVIHIQQGLVQIAHDYANKKVSFIAINANDVENYPDDSPEKMVETAQQYQYPFPYLFDETQETAKAYHAACTPDIYLFDGQLKLVYRGQFDDSRPGNDAPVNGHSLRQALDKVLADDVPDPAGQKPSMGCNIKWKHA